MNPTRQDIATLIDNANNPRVNDLARAAMAGAPMNQHLVRALGCYLLAQIAAVRCMASVIEQRDQTIAGLRADLAIARSECPNPLDV